MTSEKANIVLVHEDAVEAKKILTFLDCQHMDFGIRWLSNMDELERVIRFEKFQLVLLGHHKHRDSRKPDGFLKALNKIRAVSIELPVIVIMQSISVELFTECVKHGIADLILLEQLDRLIPSITKSRLLHDARRKAFDATKALAERELHFQVLFEESSQGIMIYTKSNGGYACEFVNQAFKDMFEISIDEDFYQGDALAFIEHRERERIRKVLVSAIEGRILENCIEFKALTTSGVRKYCQASIQLISWHGKPAIQSLIQDVTGARLAEKDIILRDRALASIGNGIFIFRVNELSVRVIYCNDAFEILTGYSFEEIEGNQCPLLEQLLNQGDAQSRELASALKRSRPYKAILKQKRKDGTVFWNEMLLSPVVSENDDDLSYVGVVNDVTEAKQDMSRLAHNQKLESIGQLAAGIAHEINTPTQYVGDNIHFLRDSFQDLLPFIVEHSSRIREVGDASSGLLERVDGIDNTSRTVDLDYLVNEIPLSLEQALEGVQRIAGIVQAMKAFSHPDTAVKVSTDINEMVSNTITVCRNEWKYLADMQVEMADSITLVCYPQELSQVVLNLIVKDRLPGHPL